MLGIPQDYLLGEVALVPQGFIDQIVSARGRGGGASLSFEFREHPHWKGDDVRALISERQTPPRPPPPGRSGEADDDDDVDGETQEWHLVRLARFPKKAGTFARSLPGRRSRPPASGCDAAERSYAESLEYVALANFARTWKDAHGDGGVSFKRGEDGRGSGVGRRPRRPDRRKYDEVLGAALKRVYDDGGGTASHVDPALAVLEDADAFVAVHLLRTFSARDAVDFSPSFLSLADTFQKPLFVTYQLLHATRELHSRGMCLGDITLSDVAVEHNYYVTVRPNVEANVSEVEGSDVVEGRDSLHNEETCTKPVASSTVPTHRLGPGALSRALHLWRRGRLSNFDYLMFLNYLCGRSCENPNYYPVLPWVRDFSSEIGGWRDLSKSKFRINKGDQMLDLTYETLSEQNSTAAASSSPSFIVMGGANSVSSNSPQPVQPPHHVTEVLSEITHYVYKARRTSRSVLCKHVRNRWVPAEYPSSIERLQAWTPDECIPDFYVDPSIFRSLHADLPDLELPSWCNNSPEDFIEWHRASLESNHVSEKLHLWIDLNFGYKLSGGSAIRAKNVCLPLVDGHCDLRRHGVVQIFTHPHPGKEAPSQYWSKSAPPIDAFLSSLANGSASSDSDSEGAEEEGDGEIAKLVDVKDREEKMKAEARASVVMPKDFEPMLRLNELELLHTFLLKCDLAAARRKTGENNDYKLNLSATEKCPFSYRSAVRDMQVLGCLIMELFMPKKFVSLGANASLKARYDVAVAILRHEGSSVPLCIRQTAKKLLHRDFDISATDKYPSVDDAGLPQPTAFQLLSNSLSSLHFPPHFAALAKILRCIDASQIVPFKSQLTAENIREVAEFRVKLAVSELQPLYKSLRTDDLPIVLPMVKTLFLDTSTAVLAAWYMFEPFGRLLGPRAALDNLLHAMLAIYEGSVQTSKHLKLYHRSFLQFLMLRFGTAAFLRYFSTYLIEAVGGYKDFEDDGLKSARLCRDSDVEVESDSDEDLTPKEERLAEGEVFAFDTDNAEVNESYDMAKNLASKGEIYIPDYVVPQPGEDYDEGGEENFRPPSSATSAQSGGNIAQVASESVMWLAHRIGPILTAKYLTRNLLRMLNLCYAAMKPEEGDRRRRLLRHADHKIRVGYKRHRGDVLAQNVLHCLSEIACLYGDQVILLHMCPYTWDLVTLCKRRMTPNLEGGLIGCVELTHHIIPYLSDSVLMNELPDNIVANVLIPALQIATSRTASFSGGAVARKTLLYKCLDVIYLIGLRIGEEMARSHLAQFSSAFFSSFDKVWDATGRQLKISDDETASSVLGEALDSELAYAAYIAFYNLMGRTHLEESIINLGVIRSLCLQEQEAAAPKERVARPAAFNCYMRLHHNSGGGGGGGGEAARESLAMPDCSVSGNSNPGNKIVATSGSSASLLTAVQSRVNEELHAVISKESSITANSSRHLRGNWLAYWEHEIGRGAAEKRFNLKQIKLQTFSGHSAVKALHVLRNESSFLSAGSGRDKSVKVWSLRSQGDGNATVGCQWSYGHHKKSVFSVSFLESSSLAVSCDNGSFHVWDPFIGSPVSQVDPGDFGSFLAMTILPSPSPTALVAAHDGKIKMIDTRIGRVVSDLKVSIMGATGQVKVLAARDSLLIAGHGTGYVSLLDTRTGKLRNAWKAHEGEVLTVTPLEHAAAAAPAPASEADFVSSSLDQTVRFWNTLDGGKLVSSLAVQDPIHCASLLNGELILGSQANRISVRHVSGDHAQFHSNKLRSDVVKGSLTSMKALEMNRMLLLGLDNGQTVVMC